MNLTEFKSRESEFFAKSKALQVKFQLFNKEKGIKTAWHDNEQRFKTGVTVFENELEIPTNVDSIKAYYLFVEVDGLMYYVSFANPVGWKEKLSNHFYRRIFAFLNPLNTAEAFLRLPIPRVVPIIQQPVSTVITEVAIAVPETKEQNPLVEAAAKTEVRPAHYGGEFNPFEPIKIINYYKLGFSLGNAIKYVLRAGKKDSSTIKEDLEKAITYLQFEVKNLE
jgi:hypothetical protein